MEPVSLAEYFDGREGLNTTRPASEYKRRPAVLVNPEAADPRFREVYQFSRGRTPSEGVATLANATIFGGGTIRVDDGRFLTESVYLSLGQSPAVLGASYADTPVSQTFDEAVFVGRYVQTENYGHFLVEVLPRLLLDHDTFPSDAPILLHDSARPRAASVLRVAGLDPARIVWIGREPVRAETLYWPVPNTLHPLHHSPHIFPRLRTLAEAHSRDSPHRRLFVSRADTNKRRLLNEHDVVRALAPWGFERVLPAQMPFEEQVRLFAEASVVVAICGAGLTNMVFMPPGGTAVMMSPSSVPGYFFWDIAHHCDIGLIAMWGRNDDQSDSGQHADFWMDIGTLEASIPQAVTAGPGPEALLPAEH
jgi:Glycosyltransferase 61